MTAGHSEMQASHKHLEMCKFTVQLMFCPCLLGRGSLLPQRCVRENHPFELYLPNLGRRHALDIQDGIKLVSEKACDTWKAMHGANAKPSMSCRYMEWAHEDVTARAELEDYVLCMECLRNC
jgi:hypothetical protein